jgi:hypothetical protein
MCGCARVEIWCAECEHKPRVVADNRWIWVQRALVRLGFKVGKAIPSQR